MAQKKFSELEAGTVDGTSVFAQTKTEDGSLVSKSASSTSLAGYIGTSHQFAGLSTTAKNLVGAINEAAQSGGGASVIQLTQAEYTALSTAEKMNGSIYKLTDKAIFYCLDEEYHPVKELTTAQYEALTTAEQNNGTIYIQTDAETTASDIPYSQGVSVADKLDNVPTFYTLTTSDNNKLLGVSVSGSDVSVGAVELIKSGTATLNSPRITINSENGTYYRIGDIVEYHSVINFGTDGQSSGLYFAGFNLDGISLRSVKAFGCMVVDNDFYVLSTASNMSIWVNKAGSVINANVINGKTAYINLIATA